MKSEHAQTKKQNTFSGIWLIALLLLLFIFATGALLASILKGISSGEHNVIALFPTKAVETSAMEVTYIPAEPDPEIEASDGQSRWETSTDIDLFKTSYIGTNGEVTVKSENGDKIIAPGTTNSYRFSLKNTGNVSLDYKMNLQGLFEFAQQTIPFEIRLSRGNDWIVGNDEQWGTVEELNQIVEQSTLGVGKYVIYTLEWQWPFENDEEDMLLLKELNAEVQKNNEAAMDADFVLSINTISEATPGAIAEDASGNPVYSEVISQRNITYVGIPALLAGMSLLAMIFLLFWRRGICLTGMLAEMDGGNVIWKTKSEQIDKEGKFTFTNVPCGNHTFTIGQEMDKSGELSFELKRDKSLEGIQIVNAEEKSTIIIGKGINAVEVHLQKRGAKYVICEDKWTATDRHSNIYTSQENTAKV